MLKFEVEIPHDLDGCLDIMARYGPDAAVLAGGTDLFILIRSGLRAPKFVVPLGHVADLRGTSRDGGKLSLGPGLTHSEIGDLGLAGAGACLTQAAGSVGSPQIRNAGTVGGNIANASPAADLYPPLLALDAEVGLLRRGDERRLTLDAFVKGPGMTALRPDEIIGDISVVIPEGSYFSAYAKVGLRNALAISVASAAIVTAADGGALRDVRVACGAVAPRPIRMRKVERLLETQSPTEQLIEEAGRLASSECEPLTDVRASSSYRRHVTGVIVSRLVRRAVEELLGYDDS
jgi:carbon-monoxide dehydrogenase medium subunit